jgi:hypothetical protein
MVPDDGSLNCVKLFFCTLSIVLDYKINDVSKAGLCFRHR